MAMEDFFLDHISLQYEGYYNAAHTSTNSSAASIPTDHYLAAWYATGMPSLATPPDGYSYFSQNADYALHGYSSQSEPEAGYPYTCPRSGPTNDSDGADHNVAPSCLEEQENPLYEFHQGYPSSDLALLTTSGIDASFSAVTECCDFSQDDPYPYPYAFPTLPSSLQQLSDDPPYMSLPPHHTAAINRWKCPHCSYVQGRRRMVDLKRHIATHNKPSDVALWTCCGYPRDVARQKGLPDDLMRGTPVIRDMVGGCWETFSRRDALQRHLRKQKGRCFGDAYASWHPGNGTRKSRS
ncbi:hypothetical protein BD311DRAFT_812396 [Dichomitus squalens]|uniref:C2H2-type domain-containing protein n=1 Tax=Dichomitus squalens TaxID=114155 RepID=A0A4Q9M3D8_9APHY|nr:hypothetical protein BD311DRAFT_812396 [Dichomitus squalens]